MTAEAALLMGKPQEAGVWAEKARSIGEEVGDVRWALRARMLQASARCELGDLGGLDQLQKTYDESVRSGWGEEMAVCCDELSFWLWLIESPAAALRMNEEGIEKSEQRGLVARAVYGRAVSLWMLYDLGQWDKVLDIGRLTVERSRQQRLGVAEVIALPYMAQAMAWRQQLAEADSLCEKALSKARQMKTLPTLALAVVIAAFVASMRDQLEAAVALIEELDGVTRHSAPYRSRHLPTALRLLVAAGEVERAVSFAHGLEVTATRDRYCVLTGRAILAEAKGHTEEARVLYEEAAERWADYGFVPEEGQAHLGLGRCFVALDDRQAATQPLHRARAIFSRLGAVPLIEEVDRHLGKATALSS
jgi:tetratricopeptide (TPR) repeat protein